MNTVTINTSDDIIEIEKVPFDERCTEKNIYELLQKGAALNPDATAIAFFFSGEQYKDPATVTYAQFMHKVTQAANMFQDMGIGPSDRVAYVLGNFPQTHYTLWGAETAGIACPVNPLMEATAIRDILNSLQAKVLVTLGDIPGVDIWKKIDSIRRDIPSLKFILQLFGQTHEPEGIFNFDEEIERYPGDALTFDRIIAPSDIASIYHTGGTTGMPKLARRTHFNEVAMAHQIGFIAGEVPHNATALCGLPLFHCNGTILTGLYPFSIGARVVLLSPMGYREPGVIKNFYKIIEHYRAFTFSAVPTLLSTLLTIPTEGADLSSLAFAISGAAPLSTELYKKFEEHTGIKIMEGYGLTESTVCASVNPRYGEKKIGSVGLRFPYTHIKTFVLDDDGMIGREAAVNEIGVVAMKGPNIFAGYVDDAHNRGSWLPDFWFNTGDLGRIDHDGYCWLTGRKKELIIRGGHNIDPAAIEEPLYKMAGVKIVAAVGKPDAYAGEVPVAYVELHPGATISADDIMAYAKENIGERAAVPKDIYVLDSMPLTPIGKVYKPALVYDATRRVVEQELEKIDDMIGIYRIQVGADKTHGKSARINITAKGATVDDIINRANQLLSPYTFHYTITIDQSQQ